MRVEIEPGSGFCFGVENAVNIAEEALQEGERVYCLGEIVHNENEVRRLHGLGLVTVTHDEFSRLHNCKVLIRAHGEPPETYATARANGITIIEATCPIVHSLQDRIKKAAEAAESTGTQVVIYGKRDHAEVIGLLGAAGGKAVLVTGPADLAAIDFTRPVALFSQTTKSRTGYDEIASLIEKNLGENRVTHSDNSLKVYNTICRQVSGREPRLKQFSASHDVIIFVSGRESSNGRMLYEVCRGVNSRSHFISSADELVASWFDGAATVGVCGATSTPRWLIREVADTVAQSFGKAEK